MEGKWITIGEDYRGLRNLAQKQNRIKFIKYAPKFKFGNHEK